MTSDQEPCPHCGFRRSFEGFCGDCGQSLSYGDQPMDAGAPVPAWLETTSAKHLDKGRKSTPFESSLYRPSATRHAPKSASSGIESTEPSLPLGVSLFITAVLIVLFDVVFAIFLWVVLGWFFTWMALALFTMTIVGLVGWGVDRVFGLLFFRGKDSV